MTTKKANLNESDGRRGTRRDQRRQAMNDEKTGLFTHPAKAEGPRLRQSRMRQTMAWMGCEEKRGRTNEERRTSQSRSKLTRPLVIELEEVGGRSVTKVDSLIPRPESQAREKKGGKRHSSQSTRLETEPPNTTKTLHK